MSDLMLFMTWLGFSTQRISEGRAALIGKFGTQVFSPGFTMRSDPYHPLQQGRPFDMEGFATQSLRLIDKGVPTDLAHDRRTAKLLGAKNTGHANLQPDSFGPVPGSIVVEGGDSSLDEMIAGTERGLYVAQFHYTNPVDAMAMTVTGMTRAGLWLIENGKLGKPCNNLRFTESLIRAFSGVEAIGRHPVLKSGGLFGGGMVLPPVKLKAFTFSSGTEF
jgi:predicted Zn-dependent protease